MAATDAHEASSAGHLLVVDDDDRIRDLLKQYLARAGFRITSAPDARASIVRSFSRRD